MNIVLLVALVTLSLVSAADFAFANSADKFHAQYVRGGIEGGYQYDVEVSDLFMTQERCDVNDVAVATQWVVLGQFTWLEQGITAGNFGRAGVVDDPNQSFTCYKTPISYYGYSLMHRNSTNHLVQHVFEFKEPSRSLNPVVGTTETFQILQETASPAVWYMSHADGKTPYGAPSVALGGDTPNRQYQIGIEANTPPHQVYSNIPNTHFKNYKMTSNGGSSWTNTVLANSPNTDTNYRAESCPGQHFVAGNVRSLDCNRATTTNSAPVFEDVTITDKSSTLKEVEVEISDADDDYLRHYITSLPTNGDMTVRGNIINTDAEMEDLNGIFTNSDLEFEFETSNNEDEEITVYVTDERTGHTKSRVITLEFDSSIGDAEDPDVQINSPLNGARITSDTVDIRGEATDNDEIESIVISFDEDGISDVDVTVTQYWAALDIQMPENLSPDLAVYYNVTATDKAGNTDSDRRHFFFGEIDQDKSKKVSFKPITEVKINPETTSSVDITTDNGQDDDLVVLKLQSAPLWTALTDNGNGSGKLFMNTTNVVPNDYPVTINATDNQGSDLLSFNITVNQPTAPNTSPALNQILNVTSITEKLISFTVNGTDSDVPSQTLTFSMSDEPDGATLIDGLFEWTPSKIQNGTHNILFIVQDDGVPVLNDTQNVVFTIAHPDTTDPVLEGILRESNNRWFTLDFNEPMKLNNTVTDVTSLIEIIRNDVPIATAEASIDSEDSSKIHVKGDLRMGKGATVLVTYPTNLDNITDLAGNPINGFTAAKDRGTKQFTFEMTDIINPAITVPNDYTTEATAILTPLNSTHYGNATATDDRDPADDITIANNSTGFFGLGDSVLEWTATDKAGNNATDTQKITIVDTTTPVITVPDGKRFLVDTVPAILNHTHYGNATAFDIFGIESLTNNATAAFPSGNTTITYNATDNNGLSVIAHQTITVIENVFGSSTTDLTVSQDQTMEISGNNDYRNLTIEDGGILIADGIIRVSGNYTEKGTGHIQVSQSGCNGGQAGTTQGGTGAHQTRTPPQVREYETFVEGGDATQTPATNASSCTDFGTLNDISSQMSDRSSFVSLFGSLLGSSGSDGTEAEESGDGGDSGSAGRWSNQWVVGSAGGKGGTASNGVDGIQGMGKVALYLNNITSTLTVNANGTNGENGLAGSVDFGNLGGGLNARPGSAGQTGQNASFDGTLGSEGSQGGIVMVMYQNGNSSKFDIDTAGGLGGFNGADSPFTSKQIFSSTNKNPISVSGVSNPSAMAILLSSENSDWRSGTSSVIAPSGETYSVGIGGRSVYSPSQANSLDNGSLKNMLDSATLNGSWTVTSSGNVKEAVIIFGNAPLDSITDARANSGADGYSFAIQFIP